MANKRYQKTKLYRCTFTPAEAAYMTGWLVGKTFGYLKVIAYNQEESIKKHAYMYNCTCTRCGTWCVRKAYDIIYGKIVSCGCIHEVWSENKIKDLTGKKFGELTVLERIKNHAKHSHKQRDSWWKCKCSCGSIFECRRSFLLYSKHPSCGCYARKRQSESKSKDLSGQRFGMLTAIEKVDDPRKTKNNRQNYWKCICDCGNTTVVGAGYLTNGDVKTCGCGRAVSSLWERRIISAISVAFPQYTIKGYHNNGEQQLRLYYTDNIVKVKRRYYSYDGAINDTIKVIIECNGTRYHPRTPTELFENGTPWTNPWGKSAKERFEHDRSKIDLAIKRGYNVILVWDDKPESECIQFIINTIKHLQKGKNEIPRLFEL